MYVIGLMSGTSGDGVDAALVRLRGQGGRLQVTPVAFASVPYAAALQRRIVAAGLTGTVREICHLNVVLGEWFAKAALKVVARAGIPLRAVSLIGSHGQTVHHLPNGLREPGLGMVVSTLQIGEAAVIAERTGITTVANFRARDMAAGGQGAPLVPFVHHLLFRHPTASRLIVNLGGISNVTYLAKGGAASAVRAFDTGPANMLLDGLVQRMSGGRHTMDRGGALAGRGTIQRRLLNKWMRHPFFRRRPPKSTGREEFGEPFLAGVMKDGEQQGVSSADLLATLARLTGEAVGTAKKWLPAPLNEVLVGGGGVRNRAVMEALHDVFDPVPVRTLDDIGWSSRALEATAFAILAYETYHGRSGTLPTVTGASHPVMMGHLVPGRVGTRWVRLGR